MLSWRRPAVAAAFGALASMKFCVFHDSASGSAERSSVASAEGKLRVGVLGATGTVGQQFLKYLDNVSIVTTIWLFTLAEARSLNV